LIHDAIFSSIDCRRRLPLPPVFATFIRHASATPALMLPLTIRDAAAIDFADYSMPLHFDYASFTLSFRLIATLAFIIAISLRSLFLFRYCRFLFHFSFLSFHIIFTWLSLLMPLCHIIFISIHFFRLSFVIFAFDYIFTLPLSMLSLLSFITLSFLRPPFHIAAVISILRLISFFFISPLILLLAAFYFHFADIALLRLLMLKDYFAAERAGIRWYADMPGALLVEFNATQR
jgi:hypothetical protein